MLKIDKTEKTGLIVGLFYFSVNLILNIICDFQQTHNDYWDLLFMAKNINFCDANTLFNQFMPFGYPLLLYVLIRSGSDIVLPALVNMIVVIFLSYFFYSFLQKVVDKRTAIFSILLFSFLPINFFYFNQAGGDVIAVFFFMLSSFSLINSFFGGNLENTNYRFYIFYGMLSGIGALFRYHVLISSFLLMFSLFFFKKGGKVIPFFIFGIFIVYSLQIVINVLSGHGILETHQSKMSVYMVINNNWFNISKEKILLESPLQIINNNWPLFLKRYIINFVKYFIELCIFPILGAILLKNKTKKISLFITIFILLYLSFFSAFFSRRMPLLILPFTMLCFGFLVDRIICYCKELSDVKKTKIIRTLLYSFMGLLFLTVAVKDAFYFKMRLKESKVFLAVEKYLKENGCSSAFQTFTTDFNFYFRTFPEHIGYINGGWSRIGTYKFNEVYPEMSVNSLEEFIADCKKHRIKFLLLTKDAYLLLEDVGKIYSFDISHPYVAFRKEIERFRIFELL